MPTTLPPYNVQLPTEGEDIDSWGGYLNGNWTIFSTELERVDTELTTLDARVAALEGVIGGTRIPVGGLYLSATDVDPAATLGYGTWAAHGAGRALVGVGTADGLAWAAGDEAGEVKHTLIADEIPAHTHKVDPPAHVATTGTDGDHQHTYSRLNTRSGTAEGSGSDDIPISSSTVNTGAAGAHNHNVTVDIPEFDSGAAGGGSAHSNLQPSIAVYVWRRLT